MNFGKRELVAAELAALAVIVAAHVFLLTRLLHTGTTFDEGVYLLSLQDLRHGEALGRQVFTSQGPGFYVLLQAIGATFGTSVAGVRLGIVTVDALGAVFAFLLGRRLAGPVGGLACAGMIAIAPKLPDFGGRIFADAPAMVLVVAALWLVSIRRPLPAGAVFAAAVLVKLSALTALPTLVILLALRRERVRRLIEAAAGALVLIAVVALVYVRDLGSIWSDAVSYHVTSRRITGLIGRHQFEGFFALKTPFFWLTLAALALLPLVWRRVWPLWLWALFASVFVLRYQPLHDNHLLVLPYAFAVPAGVSLGLAAQRLRPRTLAVALAAAALVLAAGWVQQLHRVRLDRQPEDPTLVAAAAKLEQLTRPGDLVISDQPIVAFLAHRRVPGKYVDTASLRFDTGSLTEAEVLRDTKGVAALFAGRAFFERPTLKAALRTRFTHRVTLPGGAFDLLWPLGWTRERARHRRRRLSRLACRRAAPRRRHDPFVARQADYDLTVWDDAGALFADARPELVFHLAAEVGGIGANRANPGRYWYANLIMGAHVLEQSRLNGVGKLVVAGTVCAYPKFTPVPFHEEDLWNGYPEETNAPYGVAKKSVLVGAQSYREQYGLRTGIPAAREPLRPARQLRPRDLARDPGADPQDDRGRGRGRAVGRRLTDA